MDGGSAVLLAGSGGGALTSAGAPRHAASAKTRPRTEDRMRRRTLAPTAPSNVNTGPEKTADSTVIGSGRPIDERGGGALAAELPADGGGAGEVARDGEPDPIGGARQRLCPRREVHAGARPGDLGG